MPRGVPLGSILGPLLYSIHANDLPLNVKHCQMHMYADDVQLYISCTVDDAPNSYVRNWSLQPFSQDY